MSNNNDSEPRYPKPKIMVIDTLESANKQLLSAGFNVAKGSFGNPYRISNSKHGDMAKIFTNFELSNIGEQEIVVIDLERYNPLPESQVNARFFHETEYWVEPVKNAVDPIPLIMHSFQEQFERIVDHGGILIVFGTLRTGHEYAKGKANYYGSLEAERNLSADNYSFHYKLTETALTVKADFGNEMSVINDQDVLGALLEKHLKGASFSCTYDPKWQHESWLPLAKNKYGNTVAGILAVEHEDNLGLIFLLPQLSDKGTFLEGLIKDVLPGLSPHLFPYFEGQKWNNRSEYQVPKVVEIRKSIELTTNSYLAEKKRLEDAQRAAEEEFSFLTDILQFTGDPLVAAVKKVLEYIGFNQVIDVDNEMAKQGDNGPKNEDLQIHDNSPTLIVEIKGINGLPRDAAALQVNKYIVLRSRQWKRTDIQGLAIINHERNIPPLNRQNDQPFRQEIVLNAEESGFGLMTTWDLYILARSYIRNSWSNEVIGDIFYRTGRIDTLPTGYQHTGKIEEFRNKINVISIRLEYAISLGDKIAIRTPCEFIEIEITSMQVNKAPVSIANPGDLVGIKLELEYDSVKKGLPVYKLQRR